jgi:hypothetical protein
VGKFSSGPGRVVGPFRNDEVRSRIIRVKSDFGLRWLQPSLLGAKITLLTFPFMGKATLPSC